MLNLRNVSPAIACLCAFAFMLKLILPLDSMSLDAAKNHLHKSFVRQHNKMLTFSWQISPLEDTFLRSAFLHCATISGKTKTPKTWHCEKISNYWLDNYWVKWLIVYTIECWEFSWLNSQKNMLKFNLLLIYKFINSSFNLILNLLKTSTENEAVRLSADLRCHQRRIHGNFNDFQKREGQNRLSVSLTFSTCG